MINLFLLCLLKINEPKVNDDDANYLFSFLCKIKIN